VVVEFYKMKFSWKNREIDPQSEARWFEI